MCGLFGDDNKDGVAQVVQDSHYYPYGMTISNPGGFAPNKNSTWICTISMPGNMTQYSGGGMYRIR